MAKFNIMQKLSVRGFIVIILLAIAVAGVTVLAVVPSLRSKTKSVLFGDDRQILAKTSGLVMPEGPYVMVLKIRDGKSLFIEVYSSNDQAESPTLLQSLALNEVRDGYFNFQGNATNLAMADTDQDGAIDLLAPTYDDQMTARLNVFRYNRALGIFERVSAPEESKSR